MTPAPKSVPKSVPTSADLPDLDILRARVQAALAGPARRATIAVPLTWPEIRNAEYEVIKRICLAAEAIGSRVIVTDNNGYPVWASDGAPVDTARPLGRGDADFMISLHFETPRLVDLHSYYAIWQPVPFYFQFGYAASTAKVLTHTDALSCSAGPADDHIRLLMQGAGTWPEPGPETGDASEAGAPLPLLFHSPAGPALAPAITDASRLFYVGINWERLGKSGKGRFHELLRLLDEADMVDIYGPRRFLGAQPWEGYACYRGELPFDGRSVVRALHRSGICFAMSSAAHQASGVMSNRLFEGLSAGTAIIANPHPIIDRYFSDLVWQIDDTVSDEEIFFQVGTIIDEIRADPAAANARASAAQDRFTELFSLETCLQGLVNLHPGRAAARAARLTPVQPVTLVFPHAGPRRDSAAALLAELRGQDRVAIHLVLVWDRDFARGDGAALIEAARADFAAVTVIEDVIGADIPGASTGAALAAALPHVTTPHVGLVTTGERYFHDHFASLAQRLESAPGAVAAASGRLDEDWESAGHDRLVRRSLAQIAAPMRIADLMSGDPAAPEPGRYLFATGTLRGCAGVLPLLDAAAVVPGLIAALRPGGAGGGPAGGGPGLVQTGQASYLQVLPLSAARIPTPEALARDRRFIRDSLAFDATLAALLPPEDAQAPGAPAATATGETGQGGDAPPLIPGEVRDIRAGAPALALLAGGFSHPEETAIWIDGLAGTLRFRIPRGAIADEEEADLIVMLAGRPAATSGRPQHVTLALNGVTLGYFALTEAPSPITLRLPRGLLRAEEMRLRILADHAEPVRNDGGMVVDPRRLGILVSGIGLMRAAAVRLPLLVPNAVLDMARGGPGQASLIDGALPQADALALSDGPTRLRIRLPEPAAGVVFALDLDLAAIESETAGDPVTLQVQVDDGPSVTLTPELQGGWCRVPLPRVDHGDDHGDGIHTLLLEPSHGIRIRGGNQVLSARLRALRLVALSRLAPGIPLATVAQGNGLALLRDGFSAPEPEFTWIDGADARLAAQLDAADFGPDGAVLMLDLAGYMPPVAAPGQAPWSCAVTFGGHHLGTLEVGVLRQVHRLAVPAAALAGEEVAIDLAVTPAPDQVRDPASGAVIDPRRLGVNLACVTLHRPGMEAAPETDPDPETTSEP